MATLNDIAASSKASQGAEEMFWLLNKVAKVKPKVILEIGVHLGHSLKAWQDAFEPELLIGIDNERNETLDKYLDDAELICSFVEGDSTDPQTLTEVKELLGGKAVDFLFIDGDHTYDTAMADYKNYSPLVRKGGVIAFHDAAIKDHPLVDVHKVLEAIKDPNHEPVVYHMDANGIGVLYV